MPPITFDNTYARELPGFYLAWKPAVVPAPRLLYFSTGLAAELGWPADALAPDDLAQAFAGNRLPAGVEPIAQAYAGHQFGGFSPQLGDGRALLLGEVIDRHGDRRDIAFKGSGRTPFSRGGDGKAAVGPMLREAIIGEAMHALGVPTTRALAVVATGETVMREAPLPGAVLTRVAASHLRVGTFQFFAARGEIDKLRQLAEYAIARHDPALIGAPGRVSGLLRAVAKRQATLIAQWMNVGFIHGVMNTDNMTISGESIDFGPCAFMEAMDPATVFSSIDHQGRYAYGNQPHMARWNLAKLAEALLPLVVDGDDRSAVDARSWRAGAPSWVLPMPCRPATPPTPRSPTTGWISSSANASISRSPGGAWPMPLPGKKTRCAPCSATGTRPMPGWRAGVPAARPTMRQPAHRPRRRLTPRRRGLLACAPSIRSSFRVTTSSRKR
jgi:uncharacterized protein YdiU (UPF0061 family)